MILREVFVALGLTVDESSMAKAKLAADGVEKGLSTLVNTAKKVYDSFVENTKAAIEHGNKLAKTSASIGVATDALQELQYAAQLSDVSAEEMSQTLGILARNMVAAKNGSEGAQQAFKGIEYKKADGTLKSVDEALATIAEKFSEMPNGVEKTAAAMKLFGRSGKALIPLLNEGADGIDELREEARDLGLVMSGEAVEASEKLNDNFERLHMVSKGLWQQAITPLLPAISDLVKRFLEWRKENAKILAQKLQGFIKGLITGVGALGTVFAKAVDIINVVKNSLLNLAKAAWGLGPTFRTVAVVVAAALGVAFAPLAAISAAVAGFLLVLDDVQNYYSGKKRSAFGLFKKALDEWLKPSEKDPWWLSAVKDLVRLLQDAITLKYELDEAMGRVNQKEIDRRAGQSKGAIRAASDAQTMKSARQRVSQGLALTPEETFALQRAGVPAEAFLEKYAPKAAAPIMYSPGPGGGGSSVKNQSVVVNVNANGMSAEEAEPMIRRVLQSTMDQSNEETAASFSAVP